MGSFTSSTLPRAKLTNSLSLATASFRFKDIDYCSPPTEQAPKSPEEADLLLVDASVTGSDSNPLRMLRSKNFAVVARSKASGKVTPLQGQQQPTPQDEQLDPVMHQPESPSYLTNADFASFHGSPACLPADGDGANNPIPLPPRDRNKPISVNQKRHVRKYPLIIPATGLQRTLNKVTQVTPIEEKTVEDVFAKAVDARAGEHEDDPDQASRNLDVLHKSFESQKLHEIKQDLMTTAPTAGGASVGSDLPSIVAEQLAHKHGYSREFLENNFPNINAPELGLAMNQPPSMVGMNTMPATTLPATIPAASAILTRRRTASDASAAGAGSTQRRQPPPPPPPAVLTLAATTARDPTYENLDIFQTHNQFCVDTASLHCESILENDAEASSIAGDAANAARSPTTEDTVDGFDASTLFDTADEKCPTAHHQSVDSKSRTGVKPNCDDDLSPSRAQPQPDGELKKSLNFVSCEDLLEFAEKPKGRARGLESDEVRIMSKVLGKKPTPEQCLLTLEFIDWDIHKAIKLCKLQTILDTYNLSLSECREALQTYDWDLHTTALKLKGGGGGRQP